MPFPKSFGGAYAARTLSVMSASILLIWLDSAIQGLARKLSQPHGVDMDAGDAVRVAADGTPVKASTLIWASANAVRHVDEWFATADAFKDPKSAEDLRRKQLQERSMIPLLRVLGILVPITENVAFESFQVLTEETEERGTFGRMERHLLRIGQDLVKRAGLADAPIGVTVTEWMPLEKAQSELPEQLSLSDGIGRAASSLPETGRLRNARPFSDDDIPGDAGGPSSGNAGHPPQNERL